MVALCGLLGMSACEIPFEIEQKGTSLIYFQAIANQDTFVVYPRYAATIGQPIENDVTFDVTLQVNGEKIPLDGSEKGVRHCRYAFREGDQVSVTVGAEGLPTVEGLTTVMEKPVVADMSWKEVRTLEIQATQVTLTLQHTPQDDEYYAIQIPSTSTTYYSDGTFSEYSYYETPGYILSSTESFNIDLDDFLQLEYSPGRILRNGNYRPFVLLARKHFEGNKYSFYLNSYDIGFLDEQANKATPVGAKKTYRFHLYRLSPEFYRYAKALYQSNFDFLSNMGLTPANFTYTNNSNGLGFTGNAIACDPVELVVEKNFSEGSVPE